ncbi:hypothetical protein PENTCL1PPCAC_13230 [Pristionchus entomophagus]|uniref:Uncharacterized protein n=1 Tax=Pristionchus entomophagus TaxID=358040 RepID=A0AAV5T695_9BILA|nr:hypothetical protein PENTCL1PPCAC_13230 [Pristionchus entomophagus]
MIIRGRLFIVGSLIAALISLAHCNTDEKKDGRAGKPLNPNGPSFMRKRQWTGETEPSRLATQIDEERPSLQQEDISTITLKSALAHLRWRRQELQQLQLQHEERLQHMQQQPSSNQRLRVLRGLVWLQ